MASDKKPRGKRGSASKLGLPAYMLGLPKRVTDLRKARGWTQKELARRAGVTQPKISALENGDSLPGVRATTVVGIADAFGMSIDTLLLEKPDLLKYVVTAVAEGRTGAFEANEAPPEPPPAPGPAPLRAPKSEKKRPPPRS